MVYELQEYVTQDGVSPFGEWFDSLRDKRAKARLMARLDRVALGNFGDWRSISGARGVYELRDHFGPGYRIYFSIVGSKVVLLLVGSTKRGQKRAIQKAEAYLADYHTHSRGK